MSALEDLVRPKQRRKAGLQRTGVQRLADSCARQFDQMFCHLSWLV
jgi:hypothetical protein